MKEARDNLVAKRKGRVLMPTYYRGVIPEIDSHGNKVGTFGVSVRPVGWRRVCRLGSREISQYLDGSVELHIDICHEGDQGKPFNLAIMDDNPESKLLYVESGITTQRYANNFEVELLRSGVHTLTAHVFSGVDRPDSILMVARLEPHSFDTMILYLSAAFLTGGIGYAIAKIT